MSTISSYALFDIRFKPTSTGGIATTFESSQGTVSASLGPLPEDPASRDGPSKGPEESPDRGEAVRDLVRMTRRPARRPQTNEQLGSRLFAALFAREGLEHLDQAIATLASKPHRGLCLRLHFDLNDPIQARLSQLPWELLFRPDQQRFLAQSDRTPIVRHLALPGSVPRFDLPARLRILLVAASPVDLDPLDLSPELDKIRGSWEQDNVEVKVLIGRQAPQHQHDDLGTRLREELRRGEYHVLHFMGHGTIDPENLDGVLFLETSDGIASRVSGEHFAHWLINHRSLRLVVLNACSTGQPAGDLEPFLGVAPALVRAGIPGVLAMQDPMPDALAIAFSRVLYQSLASGTSVEAALSQARVELYALRPDTRLWSTPVLFERDPQILRIPPKVGPALSKTWTLLGTSHLILVGALFLRNRSIPVIPNLRNMLDGDVGAFLAIFFGLPLFYLLLYTTNAHLRNVKLPKPANQLPIDRRFSLRLPVAFLARIQGRRLVENLYQVFFLIAFLIAPMVLQGYLFVRLMNATAWERHTDQPFASDWEHFLAYAPLVEGVTDNYRIGSIDTREWVRKELDNITYIPFWMPWGLLLAETVAVCALAIVLWRLVEAQGHRKSRSP